MTEAPRKSRQAVRDRHRPDAKPRKPTRLARKIIIRNKEGWYRP